jgi:ATP adenylyltransferase
MLRAVAIEAIGAQDARHSMAYNLLATRRWMLVVPRSRERFESISVNAFGFAGSLFVRSREQAARVREHGPMAVLREVAVARRATDR